MPQSKTLQEILKIDLPFLVAPMFLVSNTAMGIAAMQKGGAGCIPALNYRKISELKEAIREMKAHKPPNGAFGINIIVNPSNLKYRDQLKACCDEGVDFIITSLGSPREVIVKARRAKIKVFCDVVNLDHARKAEALGCDALIAVNNKAGGHRGEFGPEDLIKELVENTNLPIISAGGIGSKQDLDHVLAVGAAGASIGSPFIASEESQVSEAYKNACVSYGAKDIVMTKKISGTPCTVINTPYVQKVGLDETWLEKKLHRYRFLKKWIKLLRYIKGTQDVVSSAKEVTYKNVWVAGPSIEHTHKIEPMSKIIDRFIL
ncbi:NAD(P)H-dependent flavin oxidoreductase [Wenyingzhuangia aestuarii]|uniref:NAD(P)H-dependent flavin oxidoreductase n=1 Tax=Wenyingzhuangia aestuarii TaxID=1647582 RepID=UPI0014393959|nr:nitronate monooxygenase [Wenyingzhuangia aestuarii]NJB81398.1 nitronate monooxygenase [Wenyingzhuangia aestuarii]